MVVVGRAWDPPPRLSCQYSTPPSMPSQTLGPVTLSWCGGPVDNGTPRTDRKRGVLESTETFHGDSSPIDLAA